MQWLCINEKGEHIERIYIQACLNLDEFEAHRLKEPSDYDIVNSRSLILSLYLVFSNFINLFSLIAALILLYADFQGAMLPI